MSTRNLPGAKNGWRVTLTTLPPSMSRMSENVGASTSRNPKGLHDLYRENFTLLYSVHKNFPLILVQNPSHTVPTLLLYFRLGYPHGLVPSSVETGILYAFLIRPMRAAYLKHGVILDLMSVITSGEA
jgi:hypothetical protein